eukprot:tig00020554_g10909.t1
MYIAPAPSAPQARAAPLHSAPPAVCAAPSKPAQRTLRSARSSEFFGGATRSLLSAPAVARAVAPEPLRMMAPPPTGGSAKSVPARAASPRPVSPRPTSPRPTSPRAAAAARRRSTKNNNPPPRALGEGALEISVFDVFKIGIGPSSSHTVGPMKAGCEFIQKLKEEGVYDKVAGVTAELFGSLSLTGRGHATDIAVLLGLEGEMPDSVNPDAVPEKIVRIMESQKLHLGGDPARAIDFVEKKHLVWNRGRLPMHTNGLRFTAFDKDEKPISKHVYYSIGGGFIYWDPSCGTDDSMTGGAAASAAASDGQLRIPYPFKTAEDLLIQCKSNKLRISELMMANELAMGRTEKEVRDGCLKIWNVMKSCVERGFRQEGILPGALRVKRRAPDLYNQLSRNGQLVVMKDPADIMDWVSLFAISVNEENAAGSRVVTAPTNGAAGIIPSVMYYDHMFLCEGRTDEDRILDYMLTAAAIGILYKTNASISGAEVGCQGEVGVACSMAAGGLAAVLGGTVEQIENAAEIGMEHNLGLTCDPIGGLVQVPCIERNAMGSVKAIQSARLALRGDGTHVVSLDDVIETMFRTGLDMKSKYKETSKGGLAVQVAVPEC